MNLEKPDDTNQLMRFVSQEEIPQKHIEGTRCISTSQTKTSKTRVSESHNLMTPMREPMTLFHDIRVKLDKRCQGCILRASFHVLKLIIIRNTID